MVALLVLRIWLADLLAQDIDMLNSKSMLQDDMHHVSDHLPAMRVIGSPIIFFTLLVGQCRSLDIR